jgi:hypothetical protein
MAFGPDGDLYVANSFANDAISGGILRYDGKTGAFLDTFIAPGAGGLIKPLSLIFGPGGDLFVGSADTFSHQLAKPSSTSTVLRYDGTTGEFLGTFVTTDSGGLRDPSYLLFTESDPVTLAFAPRAKLTTASTPDPVPQSVSAKQAQPLLVETQVQGQVTGADTPPVGNLSKPVTIVGSNTGALTAGPTLDLNQNTVGWGWFVHPTSRDDSAFTMSSEEGEQDRLDLVSPLV